MLEHHSSTISRDVWDVAFSPDDRLLASASSDRRVILWNAQTGAESRMLKGHLAPVSAVAFSPDGKLLASASQDNTVKLRNAQLGAVLHTLECNSRGDDIRNVAFSPDSKLLAATTGCDVKLWNDQSGRALQTLEGHSSAAHAVAFSPNGNLLASASHESTVRLWYI